MRHAMRAFALASHIEKARETKVKFRPCQRGPDTLNSERVTGTGRFPVRRLPSKFCASLATRGVRLWTVPISLSGHQALIGSRPARERGRRDVYLAYGIGPPGRDTEPRRL